MKQALSKIRKRLRVTRCANGMLYGLLAGLTAWFVVQVISFFVPIEGVGAIAFVAVPACAVFGALLGLLWPVSNAAAARKADAAGLKERAQTALSLEGTDTPMAQVQRADTIAALSTLDAKKALPMRMDSRMLVSLGVVVLALGVSALLPNPQHAVLRAREQVRKELRAQADEIEKTAETLAEQEHLTEDEQRELQRITAEMARELRQAEDKREALMSLSERQKEMEKLTRNVQQRLSSETAEALGSQSGLSGLSGAMQSGDSEAMQAEMKKLAEQMQESQQAEQLARQLAEAALSAPAGSIAQGLQNSAAAAASGNAAQAMSQLAGACASATGGASGAGTGANLDALMRMARNAAANAGSGQGSGSGSGQGQGQGSGQGSGQGQGAGGGAGLGSTNLDMGYTPGMSQSAQGDGKGGIADRVGSYERIYDPTRLGGDNEATYAEGQKGDGESQQITLGPGQGDLNGSVPYNQVIGEYREAASQAMGRVSLPSTMQTYVNRYFDALLQ